MYFHVMLGADDIEASKRFYDATFATLHIASKGKLRDEPMAYMYGEMDSGLFFVTKPQNGKPASGANGGTVMFKAKTKDEVDAWYHAGLANGGTDGSAPAPGALPNTVMSYLRDPAGNKLAVVAFV